MTEKDKMLSGIPYDASDSELIGRWHLAKDLCRQYNSTPSHERTMLDSILNQLLGSRGKQVWIVAPFFCDYGENIHIGENTEINHNCIFLDCNRITIGSNVLIAPLVQLYTAYHPVRARDRMPNPTTTGGMNFLVNQSSPITIGDNVWIGGGAIVLPGVTIGDNTTIGAGSVVTKDIPSNVLAFGNPCTVIRKLPE